MFYSQYSTKFLQPKQFNNTSLTKRCFYILIVSIILVSILVAGCSKKLTEDKAKSILNEYLEAIKQNDFEKQKSLTAESANKFTLFKELEQRIYKSSPKVDISLKNIEVINSENNKATVEFEATIVGSYKHDGAVTTSLRTMSGPLTLKYIKNGWKITDYERDGRLLSESIFPLNLVKEEKGLKIEINELLLLPSRTLITLNITNTSDNRVQIKPADNFSLTLKDGKEIKIQEIDRAILILNSINGNDEKLGFVGFDPVDKDNFPAKLILKDLKIRGTNELISFTFDIKL